MDIPPVSVPSLRADPLWHTRFAQWLHHAPQPVCVLVGSDFVYELVNPAYQRLAAGRCLLGLPILQALPELATHVIPQLLRQVYSTGETIEGRELLVPLAQEEGGPLAQCYFNFTYQARRDEHGQVDGVVVFAHEVTEQVLARERLQALNQQLETLVAQRTRELAQQQAFLQLVVDTLPNLVYVVQQDDELVFRNAAFAQASSCFHCSPRTPDGGNEGAPGQQLRTWHQHVFASQQPLTAELPVPLPSGQTHYLQVQMHPFQDGDASPQILVVGTDVTSLKQAQQQAEAQARTQETFLARLSHEIRTPLNGVLGLTTLLQKTQMSAPQQQYVQTLQHAGQHLLTLVNEVLDLTKLSTAPLPLAQEPLAVGQVLQEAAQTLAAVAEQQGLALTVREPTPTPLYVLGDACRLRQVLLNLVGNALKFTAQGWIQLGAVMLADTPTQVRVRFWVQDSGVGIAAGEQEQIFDAFAQASAPGSSPASGTGLGLTISAQLVQQLGGLLQVCSVPQQGTTFSFTLSLPRAACGPVEAPGAPVSYEALRGRRLLLAEDNLVNQWIALMILEHWGVQVEAVTSGTDALARLQSQPYDVALLDIQMPGLSGVEVAQAVRQLADPRRATIPLIALTANAFQADQQRYLASGLDACLSKPFEEEGLGRLLLQFLPPEADRAPTT
ncbi:ATP-binding protein (plasmid) [Hymenobacter tibetensis]|uniref:histidine kinase n=1 Tax=Hymenobacter tibetensis TaxID=497967 RepID=A0ABY4D5N8_9BACT|nr:ATP-binding protein [Hymenobacter tibetensis]UOG77647.1 ATP-binding protein [Hymenobacter tibetensis]